MNNPWTEIKLDDYENHMQLQSVFQLQAMNSLMYDQIYHYPVSSVMILGIAGGNGLNHINTNKIKKVFGVDINKNYLDMCVERYSALGDIFQPINVDLTNPKLILPQTDLVIANLLLEYIGYDCFQRLIKGSMPKYVSCVIQINDDNGFISDSPYLKAFDRLSEVHHQMDTTALSNTMKGIGYDLSYTIEKHLPNGKKLVRLDYK
ncbi:class I SAM-dependent methyltransferase [Aminipila sp.]|uniref:class I SAM-dependent methyltransferase n=1 Tax=Aminipila sp. TaxID=2060095 RepID=UPI0028A00F26|nr:class I SAM-dependent methyltransferase [Aminipila sp.]